MSPGRLVKPSEHGLGHLLNPVDADADDRDWIRGVWERLLAEARGQPWPQPAWLDRAALGRTTVTTMALLDPFDTLNAGLAYADQVKPMNFLLTAHVRPLGHPPGVDPARFQLIAPFTSDARQWAKLAWTDRYSGQTFRITTTGDAGGRGIARVQTYRDALAEYRTHPEAKSAAANGQPSGPDTVGVLRRRSIRVARIRYIGKESNQLEDVEAGLVHDPDEVSTEYLDPRHDAWHEDVLPRLRERSTVAVAAALGVNVSTVKRWKTGEMRPHPRQLAELRTWLRATEA